MARLEEKGSSGLPPPPAPPRRGANPWTLSDTARKREPEPQAWPARLEDMLDDLQADEGKPQAPKRDEPTSPAPVAYEPLQAKKSASAWPLFVLLIAIGIIFKVVTQAMETGEWRAAIAPIVAILFIAHGWWRMRQRRGQKDRKEGDDGG